MHILSHSFFFFWQGEEQKQQCNQRLEINTQRPLSKPISLEADVKLSTGHNTKPLKYVEGLVNHFPNKPLFSRVCSRIYKSFENTVGKGEIARNEQFLLFPQCFQPV